MIRRLEQLVGRKPVSLQDHNRNIISIFNHKGYKYQDCVHARGDMYRYKKKRKKCK